MKWVLIPQGLCLAGAFVSLVCHGVTLYGGEVNLRLIMAMIWFVGVLFLIVNYRAFWKVMKKPFDKSASHPASGCPVWMLVLIAMAFLYAMLDPVIYGRPEALELGVQLQGPIKSATVFRQLASFLVASCWMSFCCLYGEQKSRGQPTNESTENR